METLWSLKLSIFTLTIIILKKQKNKCNKWEVSVTEIKGHRILIGEWLRNHRLIANNLSFWLLSH